MLPASVQVCTSTARRRNIQKELEVVFGVGHRTSSFHHEAVEPLQVSVSVIFTANQVRLKECPARPLAIRVAEQERTKKVPIVKSKIGLALAALTLAASPALARDPFVGGYDGGENVCAKNVSCSLIISDPLDGGKAYNVEFEAE